MLCVWGEGEDALPANAAGSSLSEMTLHVNEKARPCIVGEWSPWSGCASQCRPTARVRRRAVQQEPQNGGEPCPALEERAGCLEYATPQGEDCGHAFVPAFITTSAFNKERTRQAASPHWTTSTEDAGYCMEFKTESLTHHCALENRPLTRWMQYLREGYTVCVDCQPPAMNSVSLRCSGDGLDSDGRPVFDLGSHNSGEKLPFGRSRVQDPVHILGLRGSVPESLLCPTASISSMHTKSEVEIRPSIGKQLAILDVKELGKKFGGRHFLLLTEKRQSNVHSSTGFLLSGVEGRGIDYGRHRFITDDMIPIPTPTLQTQKY
ncbi:hypothetical protein E5288_WYG006224 [Bos mutus]|uniref:Spondin-like TSP1 domain-containing protein n=1 Tax=Bos mutus TaxID=72004 RepID=A0A6B0QRI7_9CETA|nr:hypothetical protein [Bos mutus]